MKAIRLFFELLFKYQERKYALKSEFEILKSKLKTYYYEKTTQRNN